MLSTADAHGVVLGQGSPAHPNTQDKPAKVAGSRAEISLSLIWGYRAREGGWLMD